MGLIPKVPTPLTPTGTLGCGIARAEVRTRGGERLVMDLPNITATDWGRKRGDTSDGTVEMDGVAISADPGCCALMRTIRPWEHELAIYRDDELGWCGPIQEMELNGQKLIMRGKDLSAWLDHRFVHSMFSWGGSQANQGSMDSQTVFLDLLMNGMVVEDSAILHNAGYLGDGNFFVGSSNASGELVSRTYSPAMFKPVGAELRDLAKGALDWTVVKRLGMLNTMATWQRVNPNPVVNPDAEVNTTGWSGMTRDTGVFRSGVASFRTGSPPNATGSMTGLIIGRKYRMDCYVRGTGSALDAAQVWVDDGVVKVGSDESSVFSWYVYGNQLFATFDNNSRTSWAKLSVWFTASATTMPITITASGNPIDSHGIYFDDFSVWQMVPSFKLFDHSLAVPPAIKLSGLDQVNRAIVANQQSGGDYAFYKEAPKPVWNLGSLAPPAGGFTLNQQEFGLLEGLSVQPLSDATTAASQAANQAAALGTTPILIDSLTLSEDAGVTMEQLIPGCLFELRLDEPCFAVDAQLILQSVSVKTTPASGEVVSLTFEPTGF